MSVRRILPYLLAALLGVGAALLAACGEGASGGIPSANAGDLKSQITDVEQAVQDNRCSDVPGQLRQVDEGIDDLPPSVDEQLVANLRDGADRLRRLAAEECNAAPQEPTQTETTEVEPTPTQTETTAPTTTPAETTPTATAPPPPTTTPAPPPEPAPAPEPPPPPAGTPGGGVEPELP